MKSITPTLAAHLLQNVTTLAVCWRVERADGVLILGTEHDRDITISGNDSPPNPYAGTYSAAAGITGSDVRSTSDMAVDNLEVSGAINQGDLRLVDLSAADIEAGLFDDASVVLFLVNWSAPDDGQVVLRTGNIGEIARTAEGSYRTELRGLAQRLSQTLVRTYGTGCDAELGDARCGVDLVALTVSGEVAAVTSPRQFTVNITSVSPVAQYEVTLFLPMPRDVTVGDTFTLRPGCDKSVPTCKLVFNNLVNFRGHGFWVPGIGDLSMFGGQTASHEPETIGSWFASLIGEWLATHPDAGQLYDSPAQDTPYYNGGLLSWTSGENESFSMEVKQATANSP